MDAELLSELKRRREEVAKILARDTTSTRDAESGASGGKSSALLLFSAPVHIRNGDVEHPFRQHSDFYYLTGLEEPDCALFLAPDEPGFVLFVREREREREIWDGLRFGTEGAREIFGASAAHPISDLAQKLPDLLEDRARIFYLLGEEPAWETTVFDALASVRKRRRRGVDAPSELVDARKTLHELRLKKSSHEKSQLAHVAGISAQAHRLAMAAARPDMSEWDLQNVVETEFRRQGARRVAYESIVGSGPNATILHYRESARTMQDGDLVLIDAGAEMHYLASDITRTFPVNGTFSPVQRRLYQIVLDAQSAAISATRVGATLDEIHDAAVAVLTKGLRDEGLLGEIKPDDEEATAERVKRFYMHRTSHYLGMDVHDVGAYHQNGKPRKLEENMVITVEPGLYFAADDETVPEEYRGIGIRIEDDVMVTRGEALNFTSAAPKTVDEIEAACRGEFTH